MSRVPLEPWSTRSSAIAIVTSAPGRSAWKCDGRGRYTVFCSYENPNFHVNGIYIASVGTGPSHFDWFHPPRPTHPGNPPVSHTHDRSPRCQSAAVGHTQLFYLR
jgi:hypothetical protein